MFPGVVRPNATPIDQDRKFKDLRAMFYLSKTSLFYMKLVRVFLRFLLVRAGFVYKMPFVH